MTDSQPMRDHPASAWWEREVLRVGGPDATSFLQGQLSQDIEGLAVGEAAWSFLLEPQGKVESLARVVRTGTDEVLLHVDAGFGSAVVQRLERFKLRVKADIEPLGWRVLAVRGPSGSVPMPSPEPGVVAAPAGHPGLDGFDLMGHDPSAPPGLEVVDGAHLRAALIEAGIPAVGVDLEVGAIPAESGLVDRAVSFTKGCYTGQELVARIDSRGGRAPRQLVGARLEATEGPLPEPGVPLLVGGEEVGSLTSVIGAPARREPVGLAVVKRSVEVPVIAEVAAGDGGVARLQPLPLVS